MGTDGTSLCTLTNVRTCGLRGFHLQVFGGFQNSGWCVMENPMKMDDLGVALCLENHHFDSKHDQDRYMCNYKNNMINIWHLNHGAFIFHVLHDVLSHLCGLNTFVYIYINICTSNWSYVCIYIYILIRATHHQLLVWWGLGTCRCQLWYTCWKPVNCKCLKHLIRYILDQQEIEEGLKKSAFAKAKSGERFPEAFAKVFFHESSRKRFSANMNYRKFP